MDAKSNDRTIEIDLSNTKTRGLHIGDLLNLILPKGFAPEESPKQTIIDTPDERTRIRLEFRDKNQVPKYLEAAYKTIQKQHKKLQNARSPEKRGAMRALERLTINGLEPQTDQKTGHITQLELQDITNEVELDDPEVHVKIAATLPGEGTLYTQHLAKVRLQAKGLCGSLRFVPNRHGTEGLEMLSSQQELAVVRSLIARLEEVAAKLEDEEQDITNTTATTG
ncbi:MULTISPECIES: hypothetical protein [unclassified Thioalkalivibrio]|uniref:hypothetical protein n=1 Tax=unclassified Thioalkalivibrio TaxID=2621013 RepID=UPI000362D777|nr:MULTISPECIES: hypothetical protein [unclassified Thioalkalivibrio]